MNRKLQRISFVNKRHLAHIYKHIQHIIMIIRYYWLHGLLLISNASNVIKGLSLKISLVSFTWLLLGQVIVQMQCRCLTLMIRLQKVKLEWFVTMQMELLSLPQDIFQFLNIGHKQAFISVNLWFSLNFCLLSFEIQLKNYALKSKSPKMLNLF